MVRTPTLHLSSPAQHSRTEHTKLRVIRALALRARRGRGECAQLEVARDGWSWTMCYKHPRKVHCAASQRAAYPNILVAADTAAGRCIILLTMLIYRGFLLILSCIGSYSNITPRQSPVSAVIPANGTKLQHSGRNAELS